MSARTMLRSFALLFALAACKEPAAPEDGSGSSQPLPSTPSAVASTQPKTGARAMPAGKADGERVALGTHGAVSSQEANATDIGLAILKKGGSAVDAAVAVGFALAVTHPSAGNIGGGGFMVFRAADGSSFAVDFREKAPASASRDMYLGKDGKATRDSLDGPRAAGIPGTVAGFALAHAKFGKLSWKDVVEPAVALARDGFVLDKVTAADLAKATVKMKELGYKDTAKLFEKTDGSAYAAGDKLVQADLAKTLQTISDKGAPGFYEGPMAAMMAAGVEKAGGYWKATDLASYQAKWRDPIKFSYRGHEIVTMPPPSSGGVVLQELLLMGDAVGLQNKKFRSSDEVHLFVEAMRRAFADRNNLLGDPDFVKMPLDVLVDPAYAAKRAKDIDPNKATKSADVSAGVESPKKESTQTTHYSVVDEAGNAVSVTYTLNTGYGAKWAIPGTGIVLNNEMDDFAVAPGKPNTFGLVQGEANKIEPGKRMLSSMTPTIISKDGELRAVLGSPGGPTIITTVALLTRALIDYQLPLDEAIPAFRAHNQWLPDQIFIEASAPDAVVQELEAKGHKIMKRGQIGHANCIEVDPASKGFRAVADTTRSGGKAAAY